MFGRRKNKRKEQIQEAVAQVNQYRSDVETHMSSTKESEKQMQEDISQVMENTISMTEYATQNVEKETTLLHKMDIFSEEFETAMKDYQQIVELIKENYEAVTNLVDENKHYTTPSKHLTEISGKIKMQYHSYEERTEGLAERAREISIQAINTAVEAGRLGESGKKFVAASEDLRQMALDCEQSALSMKEELENSQKKIQELEEYVLRLVSLIKEGNVGTTRLMKKHMALQKAVEYSSMRAFSEDVIGMRDEVVAMRNLEEEMIKASERNKIQLNDVQEELQTQNKELSELESDLTNMFDEALERFARKDLLMFD